MSSGTCLQPKEGDTAPRREPGGHVAERERLQGRCRHSYSGIKLLGKHPLPTDGERFKVLVETRLAQLFPLS